MSPSDDPSNASSGDPYRESFRESSRESGDHYHAPQPEAAAEAHREKFHALEIAQVLSHYDIGVIAQIREYRRGSRRSPKLKLQSERGEFLLKRKQSDQSLERAEASHAVQARAAAGGVPVAPLVELRRGGTLLSLGERRY